MSPQNKKKQKEIEDVIDSVIKDPIPTDDYLWEEDIFSKTDTQPTIDATKIIVDDIKQTTNDVLKDIDIQALSDNILRNLWPRHNRSIQELIDDDFIPIDDRTVVEPSADPFKLLDAIAIEDIVEPSPFTAPTNTSKNHFIVTIEDVLEPPATN